MRTLLSKIMGRLGWASAWDVWALSVRAEVAEQTAEAHKDARDRVLTELRKVKKELSLANEAAKELRSQRDEAQRELRELKYQPKA